MSRMMRDKEYLEHQRVHCFDEHIAPINKLVDKLQIGKELKIPYVAPAYGGVNSRVLCILQDPGPSCAGDAEGSGFLSVENDDVTAERLCKLLDEAGLKPSEMTALNAYPWYLKDTGKHLP